MYTLYFVILYSGKTDVQVLGRGIRIRSKVKVKVHNNRPGGHSVQCNENKDKKISLKIDWPENTSV